MRLEDLKKEMGETPEFIHQIVETEVERQLKETKIIPMPEKKRVAKQIGKIAVAGIAVILATSTVVYAGNKLYQMYLEKQGNYGVDTKVEKNATTSDEKIPEQIPEVKIQANYIPDGMSWSDDRHLENEKTPNQGGFSFETVLLDQKNMDAVMKDTSVVESDKVTLGGRDCVYIKYQDLRQDQSFNQRIYMLYPEEYRMLVMYIGDDISKEEAMKVAENIELKEQKEMVDTNEMYTWSQYVSQYVSEEETESGETIKTTATDTELKVYQVGESLKVNAYGEDENGEWMDFPKGVTATVDKIQTSDNLTLLEDNKTPQDWKQAVDADGKLVDNTLSYIKSGDGINTIDQVIKTETVKQKLVYVTVTYKNVSKQKINHLIYLGNLMLLNEKEHKYEVYTMDDITGEAYDKIEGSSVARTADMGYFDVQDEEMSGKNAIKSLEPGASVTVNMAWIVNENDLDHMYLNLASEGGGYEFTDATLEMGLVKL